MIAENTPTLFKNAEVPKYRCENCGNKIRKEVMIDWVKEMPDNKLTCPLCMSLDISEATKVWKR